MPKTSMRTHNAAAVGASSPIAGEPRSNHRKGQDGQHHAATRQAKAVIRVPQAASADLLAFDADDNGNAEAMRLLYGERFLFSPAFGWLAWTGTQWRAGADAAVLLAAVETLKRRRHAAVEAQREEIVRATVSNEHRVKGCLTLFQAYVTEADATVFDSDPDLLNCRNGVLNLRTGALAQHCPRQRFTDCLPVEYDPAADTTEWHNFIHEATGGDEALTHYLQECVGYSLTGHTREEKLFYLHGPTRAGKGTFTETLLALLPRPQGVEVDFNSFTAKREADAQNFDLAELKAARLVAASESNRYQSLNPAKIKQITGGNDIRAAFKHRDMFSYRPQFKVWLVSNHEVNGDPDDDALWGRVQVLTFPRSHLGEEDLELKQRLRMPGNLQGLLRWAVEGAMRWYEQGRLQPPQAVLTATQRHRSAEDYVSQWLAECCTLSEHGDDPNAWTASAELMRSYQEWCEANNVKPVSARELAYTLTRRFGRLQGRPTHRRSRGFYGIALHIQTVRPDGPHGPHESEDLPHEGDIAKNHESSGPCGPVAPRACPVCGWTPCFPPDFTCPSCRVRAAIGTSSASSTDTPPDAPDAVEEVVEPPAAGTVTGSVMVPDGYCRLCGGPPAQGAKDYGACLVCDLHDEPLVPQKGAASCIA